MITKRPVQPTHVQTALANVRRWCVIPRPADTYGSADLIGVSEDVAADYFEDCEYDVLWMRPREARRLLVQHNASVERYLAGEPERLRQWSERRGVTTP